MGTSTYQDQIDLLSGNTQPPIGDQQVAPSVDPQVEADTIAKHIDTIVKALDTQERVTRDKMLRLWKYLELLWSGAGNYYWDHNTGQWRAVTQEDIALLATEADIDPTLINKTINIIRPYGESLAGVLTTGLPRVRYYPDDADNDLDIQASKSYSTVEKRIVEDNQMPLRLIEILVKMWNGGFAAAYNYTHYDKKYGTVPEPVMGDRPFNQQSLICAECGNEQLNETEAPEAQSQETNVSEADSEEAPETDLSLDEMQQPNPSNEPSENEGPNLQMAPCPQCQMDTQHIETNSPITKNVQVGENQAPKCRQIINIYGPMNVKISSLASRLEHVYWLILEEDLDVAYARHLYPEHREKITPTSSSMLDIDRLSRSTYEIAENTLKESTTIRKAWLKPAAYEKLSDPADIEMMKAKYPDGIMAVFCSDTFLEAEESNLDDHWTISHNPLYPRVQADPLGKALIGCHETANDLFQYEIDAVRFGTPTQFADPAFLDFNAIAKTRALPGTIYPLKKPPGGRLEDVLASSQTSTLPQGIEYLDAKVEKLIQFISGVLPSVFGGPATGSKTLGEYQESKNQALQRLSIIWKIVCVMYAEMMAKSTKQYVDALKEDERFVQPQGKDSYINVWIRKEDFEGKIGLVRPELSEQFPMTWAQISQRMMDLLALNNDVITSWFLHPENVELIYKVIGIDDLYVPGEDQRSKQLYEIGEIITQSQPQENPMIPGQMLPPPMNALPIEPIDEHQLHMEVITAWLNSPMGIDLKNRNPVAYQNIMLHYQLHAQALAMQQAQQAMQQAQASPQAKGKPPQSEPVKESNA